MPVLPVRRAENGAQPQADQSAGESEGQNQRERKQRVSPIDRARVLEQLVGDENDAGGQAQRKTAPPELLFQSAPVQEWNRILN